MISQAAAPSTRVDPVRETLHGVQVVDPYRWLEDQKSPETRSWIAAQNEYRESIMSRLPGRDTLRRRLLELMRVDTVGVPAVAGGRLFFTRRPADSELGIIYMRYGVEGKDEVLVDPHPLSADKTTSVTLMAVSDDGHVIVYGLRQGGEDEVVPRIFNVDHKEQLAQLPKARYLDAVLAPDTKTLYYGKMTPQGPRIYRHKIGDNPAADPEIFGAGFGPEYWISLSLSDDGRHLLFTASKGWDRSDMYHLDTTGKTPPQFLTKGIEANFTPAFAGPNVYVLTNWKAPRGRILKFAAAGTPPAKWTEVIPQGPDTIEHFTPGNRKLLVGTLHNASSRLLVYEPDGKLAGEVPFDSLGTVTGVGGNWKEPHVFYGFTAFHLPQVIYQFDTASRGSKIWHKSDVPLGNAVIESKQVWYPSKDGTRIPMFLVYRKGMPLDGSNATWLTGYGGFNQSMTPAFAPHLRVWVEQGGLLAIPNLRGGNEFGEDWHQAGMLGRKQNVFDDFIGAAEWLIANKYTSPGKLGIRGGSNGGLLVGAAFTQRPELFRAVVCSVPLLDMVRYQNFLVARLWVPEYGSSEDAAQFKYLLRYSPYHNVNKGTKYPAILFVTGDADTRVDPLHARKMTALMQASTGSDLPVLLRYDTKFGHSQALPVNQVVEDSAHDLHFFMWQLGLKIEGAGSTEKSETGR
jgi:prolyl oligopeptidase